MIYPEIQELNTLHLHLRKMRREDAPCYYARLGSSEAVTRYMLFDPHQDPAEAELSVEKVLQRYESGRCYRWAIALPEDDSMIGIVEHIGIIVRTNAKIGLGGGVIALFKRVDEHINEGVDHKATQEQHCRQQVEPRFRIFIFHRDSPVVMFP